MMRPEALERMVNQVAANANPDHDGAVDRVAQHLRTFWTPDMIDTLADYQARGEVHLSEVAAGGLVAVRTHA